MREPPISYCGFHRVFKVWMSSWHKWLGCVLKRKWEEAFLLSATELSPILRLEVSWRQDFSLLKTEHPAQCSTCYKFSVNICWLSEQMTSLTKAFLNIFSSRTTSCKVLFLKIRNNRMYCFHIKDKHTVHEKQFVLNSWIYSFDNMVLPMPGIAPSVGTKKMENTLPPPAFKEATISVWQKP